ncbi:Iduronate sulfatase [Planctomycetales bacterium 10988]|nr:Iduronate sulfatase [Planctomycetales bacterium 10988]
MKSTFCILVSLCLLIIGVDPSSASERTTVTRPNILFIAIDDLRPTLGCYGDPIAKTPNIDQLAQQGILFQRAYCQQAVCSPSRTSLLTSRRPDTVRVWDLKTHFRKTLPNAVTLPQFFKQQGYFACSIGKIFHGSGKPSQDPPSWSCEPEYDISREAHLRYALPENLSGTGLKRAASEKAKVADDTYIDGVVCKAAIEKLHALQQTTQPFFLAVGFRKPHLPFCAPAKYWNLYEPNEIPPLVNDQTPQGAPEVATRSWQELEGYTDIPANGELPPAKVAELRHGYYACVSYVDALVGRLLRALDGLKLREQTIVVLWSDHGFHLGEQGLWTKANNYELSTRVPLMVAFPQKYPQGVRTNAIVELVDLYPSLVEACGIEVPEDLEGKSFLPLLSNPQRQWKEAAFSQFPRPYKGSRFEEDGDIMGYTVRSDRYRYVQWRDLQTGHMHAEEFYDHQTDPEEMQNLVGQSSSVRILKEHRQRLTEQGSFSSLSRFE